MPKKKVCFVSSQCYSRGVTPLPELLHCVAWVHHSASASSGLLTSLHYEGISPVFYTQWTSISHTTVLEFRLLDLKIKVSFHCEYYCKLLCQPGQKEQWCIQRLDVTWKAHLKNYLSNGTINVVYA